MIDAFIDTLELFPRGLVYVGMGVVLLAVAKMVQDLATPYHINDQLRTKDNVALAISIAGYYLGIVIVFLGAVYQPLIAVEEGGLGFTDTYWKDVLEVFLYSLGGIAVLNVARILVDKLVLYQFSTEKEIITDRNAGAGAVEAGVYIAVGLVIAGSITGDADTVGTSIGAAFAFFGLGMATLILYTLFYELTTSFKVHEEIERDNTAVGVVLAGNLIAIGIVAFKAVFGNFVGWEEGISGFLTFAVIGFGLLLAARMFIDFVMFPFVKVSNELAVDQNLGVAFIESAVVVGASLILFFAV